MTLRKRIIPCLLISENDLIKTIKFKDRKYIGDPINSIKIFNQKKADEVIILDIDSSSKKLPINFDLIKKMANESRMPISYGGGIKNFEEIYKIISLGIEKVVCSSLFFENLDVLNQSINQFGRQSISVCLDYKIINGSYHFFTNNGQKMINISLEDVLKKLSQLNPGEVIFNSIDNDGTMLGMDVNSIKYLSSFLHTIPLTFLGGLSSYEELNELIKGQLLFSGISAGSLFIFKGKLRAVLINYDNLYEYEKKL